MDDTAESVARDLDDFEVLKVRRLASTLQKCPAPPPPKMRTPFASSSAVDLADEEARLRKDPASWRRHLEEERFSGRLRPGSKGNALVIYKGRSYVRYPDALAAPMSDVVKWMSDLRRLRAMGLIVELRAAMRKETVTMALLERAWFEQSKMNSEVSLANGHSALRAVLQSVLPQSVYVDATQCEAIYALLNDHPGCALRFGQGLSKLQLVLLQPTCGEELMAFARMFFSAAFSRLSLQRDPSHAPEYVSTFDFDCVLQVFRCLVEGDASTASAAAMEGNNDDVSSVAAVFSAAAPGGRRLGSSAAVAQPPATTVGGARRRQSASAASDCTTASVDSAAERAAAFRLAQSAVGTKGARVTEESPPPSGLAGLLRLVTTFEHELRDFNAQRDPREILTVEEALFRFGPRSAFVKMMREPDFDDDRQRRMQRGVDWARKRKEDNRAALVKQMSRMVGLSKSELFTSLTGKH